MAYCSAAILIKAVEEDLLLELVDDESGGTLSVAGQARVDQAVAFADGVVNGYLQIRFAVPVSPVPDLISKVACDLALYQLHVRRAARFSLPAYVELLYKQALDLLAKIASGEMGVGLDPIPAASSDLVRYEGGEQLFYDSTLEAF